MRYIILLLICVLLAINNEFAKNNLIKSNTNTEFERTLIKINQDSFNNKQDGTIVNNITYNRHQNVIHHINDRISFFCFILCIILICLLIYFIYKVEK